MMYMGSVGADSVSARTTNPQNIFCPVCADSISARIIKNTFIQTINMYEYIHCPIYVVMPNHFHCIIAIQRDGENAADIESRADMETRADMESAPTVSLPDVIQSFKRHSTIEYIKLVKQNILPPFDKQIWQRGYYEHIIRNEHEYQKIYEYIENNPIKWEEDKYYE